MKSAARKKTKASQVFETLRLDIANGIFQPNEKLQMENLKERYGVGYSPLREALSRLASSGQVQVEEQCGFFVAPLSLGELQDLYQVRTQIETLALSLSMQHGDGQWEANVVACWHQYEKYLNPENNNVYNPAEWEALQRDFLFTLVKGCQSPWLLKIRDMLYDQADRYRSVCIQKNYENKKFLSGFLKKNAALVTAVLARKTDDAIKISEALWNDTVNIISAALKEQKRV